MSVSFGSRHTEALLIDFPRSKRKKEQRAHDDNKSSRFSPRSVNECRGLGKFGNLLVGRIRTSIIPPLDCFETRLLQEN